MPKPYLVVATDQENNNCDFFVVANSDQHAYELWMQNEFVAGFHDEDGAFTSDGEGVRIYDLSALAAAQVGVIEWLDPVQTITC